MVRVVAYISSFIQALDEFDRVLVLLGRGSWVVLSFVLHLADDQWIDILRVCII